jgi:hypothetical protein
MGHLHIRKYMGTWHVTHAFSTRKSAPVAQCKGNLSERIAKEPGA